ncbi:MAG: YggS family pyridoxal phosphate-dependent enzyme [Muribaculaceae bacterium]|nr:YggS family pyridoxal phosphate-dependent enzyme [Muribaculaceae bacterium]
MNSDLIHNITEQTPDSKAIANEIRELRKIIPEGVKLVAVSKFHPATAVMAAYEAGQRCFGESRVQELLEKEAALPKDIEWHFIGHLQTNKVRPLIGRVAMIESVDSEKLLNLIDKESQRAGVVTRVLMQLHVAAEETKFGFLPSELEAYFAQGKYRNLTNTHICGVMGMASNTDDESRIISDFRAIAACYRNIREICGDELLGFDTISMGMSHDWPLAVDEGATSIRIGTRIFGARQ